MIRAGQINGSANLTKDHDLGAFGYSLWKDLPGGGGVVEGLAVTTGSVAAGRALVVGVRTSTTPNEKFLMHIELTAAESIDTTGTKKIWLEPIAARVNDPSLNVAADGSGIAQLASGADWPATAHIRLATVASGVITDARVYTRTAAEAARDKYFNSGLATGTASAYVLELTPAPTAYANRMEVIFTAPAQNLSPVTININGLGAKTLKLPDGTTDVPAGMILSGQVVVLHYDGTNFRVTSAPYTGYNVASQAEAEAGVDNAKMMTPLRTKQAIAAGGLEGALTVGTTVTAGKFLSAKGDTERNSASTSYVKLKEFVAGFTGSYHLYFDLKVGTGLSTAYGRIYKNGVAFGTEFSTGSTAYEEKSEQLTFTEGDLIQLYSKADNAANNSFVRNFRAYFYATPSAYVSSVNTD